MRRERFRHRATALGFLILIGGGLAQAFAEKREADLKIVVSPPVAVYGTPFSLKVTGLKPGERGTV